jgi:hypothetical protein
MARILTTAALAALCGCGAGRAVYVIDQIEDGRALLVDERGALFGASLAELPDGVREGDVLVDGRRDEAERSRLQAEAQQLRERLSVGDDGTDLSLEGP